MFIEHCSPMTSHYLVIRNVPGWDGFEEFRRNGPESWQVLMGMSWEEVWNCDELEEAFQNLILDSSW